MKYGSNDADKKLIAKSLLGLVSMVCCLQLGSITLLAGVSSLVENFAGNTFYDFINQIVNQIGGRILGRKRKRDKFSGSQLALALGRAIESTIPLSELNEVVKHSSHYNKDCQESLQDTIKELNKFLSDPASQIGVLLEELDIKAIFKEDYTQLQEKLEKYLKDRLSACEERSGQLSQAILKKIQLQKLRDCFIEEISGNEQAMVAMYTLFHEVLEQKIDKIVKDLEYNREAVDEILNYLRNDEHFRETIIGYFQDIRDRLIRVEGVVGEISENPKATLEIVGQHFRPQYLQKEYDEISAKYREYLKAKYSYISDLEGERSPNANTMTPMNQLYLPLRLEIKNKEAFKLTESSFESLEKIALPNDILKRLRPLKGREFRNEDRFWAGVEGELGSNVPSKYKELLLKYAKESKTVPEDVPRRYALGDVLKDYSRVAIIGVGGSGKSTLVGWLITALIDGEKDLPDISTIPGNFRDITPLVVRCREIRKDESPLKDFLEITYDKGGAFILHDNQKNILQSFLSKKISEKKVILIFDGLDEFGGGTDRRKLAKAIDELVRVMNVPAIITSRSDEYNEMKLNLVFQQAEISEIQNEERDVFIDKWCKARHLDDNIASQIKEIIANAPDSIKQLTGNALLLSLMVSIIQSGGVKLPPNRGKLFEEFVKRIYLRTGSKFSSNWDIEDDLLLPLGYIAYVMCERNVDSLDHEELIGILAGAKKENERIQTIFEDRSPGQWITDIGRMGVLVRDDNANYEFRPHSIFRDYFAGYALKMKCFPGGNRRMPIDDCIKPLVSGEKLETTTKISGKHNIQEKSVAVNWQNVIMFCVNVCEGEKENALEAILDVDEQGEENARARSVMAALCLKDEIGISKNVAEKIIQDLLKLTQDSDSKENTNLREAVKALWQSRWKNLLLKVGLITAIPQLNWLKYSSIGSLLASLSLLDAPTRKHILSEDGITIKEEEKFTCEWAEWISLLIDNINSDDATRSIQGALALLELAYRNNLEEHFKLTKQSLNILKQENVAKSILKGLQSLADKEFIGESQFLETIDKLIKQELTHREKMLIVTNSTLRLICRINDGLFNMLEKGIPSATSEQKSMASLAVWALYWLHFSCRKNKYTYCQPKQEQQQILYTLLANPQADTYAVIRSLDLIHLLQSEKRRKHLFSPQDALYRWAEIADEPEYEREIVESIESNLLPAWKDILIHKLSDKEPRARRSAAFALGSFYVWETAMVEPLLGVFRDKEGHLNSERIEAVEYIGHIGGKQAINELIAELASFQADEAEVKTFNTRFYSMLALIGISEPGMIPLLDAQITDSVIPETRQYIATILGTFTNTEAIKALENLLQDENDDIKSEVQQKLYSISQRFFKQEDYQTALNILKKLVEFNPENPELLLSESDCLQGLGRDEDIIEIRRRAALLSMKQMESVLPHTEQMPSELFSLMPPEPVETIKQIIQQPERVKQRILTDIEYCEQFLQQVESIKDAFKDAFVHVFAAVEKAQQFFADPLEEQLTKIEQFIKDNPNDAEALHSASGLLLHLKQYERAFEIVNNATALNDTVPEYWETKGHILWKQRIFEDSLNAFEKALELNAQHHESLKSKAKLLIALKRGDVEEVFDKYLKAGGEEGEVYYQSAVAYAILNRRSEALTYLEKAIQLNEENREYAKADSDFESLFDMKEFQHLVRNDQEKKEEKE